ncbi:hypothetical protein [Leptolyngbya sp. NIES-2104]|uniref:hypothetical protein n=1 Tax=Leptolyngbya sp. NIES-2104 TaxID=1552121 RepID=UPI0006EC4716|nr:hypothetical protein [Leptolyngbya sp. NIES-2104]GAP94846.1 hypothetical protein NIES2104_13630 [Leptolyngbya sp. NIES-2104]
MAFIKLEDVVINTSYIAAIRLECRTRSGEPCVSLLIAIPPAALCPQESPTQGLYHYEWLRFTGDAARALQDYFSSFNNVIDLLPQYSTSTCCSNSSWSSGGSPD